MYCYEGEVCMSRNLYLALGDSITAGQGASQPSLGFVPQVDKFAKSRGWVEKSVTVAQPGWTAKTLHQVARTISPSVWEDAKVVSVCTGSADLALLLKPRRLSMSGNPFPPRTVLKKADEFGFHMDQLFRLIHDKTKAEVLATTLYNPFPAFGPAGDFVAGMNSIVMDLAMYYGFSLIRLDEQFAHNEAYLIDGFKTGSALDLMTPLKKPILPNNAGHRLIADLFTARLVKVFSKPKGGKTAGRKHRPLPSSFAKKPNRKGANYKRK